MKALYEAIETTYSTYLKCIHSNVVFYCDLPFQLQLVWPHMVVRTLLQSFFQLKRSNFWEWHSPYKLTVMQHNHANYYSVITPSRVFQKLRQPRHYYLDTMASWGNFIYLYYIFVVGLARKELCASYSLKFLSTSNFGEKPVNLVWGQWKKLISQTNWKRFSPITHWKTQSTRSGRSQ